MALDDERRLMFAPSAATAGLAAGLVMGCRSRPESQGRSRKVQVASELHQTQLPRHRL